MKYLFFLIVSFFIEPDESLSRDMRIIVNDDKRFYVSFVYDRDGETIFFRTSDLAYILSHTELAFTLDNFIEPTIERIYSGNDYRYHISNIPSFDINFGKNYLKTGIEPSQIYYFGELGENLGSSVRFNFIGTSYSRSLWPVRFIEGDLFLTLRGWASLLGFTYFYDSSTNAIHINTVMPYISEYGRNLALEFIQNYVDNNYLWRDFNYEPDGVPRFSDFRLIYLGHNGIPVILVTSVRWPHSNFPEFYFYYEGSFISDNHIYGLPTFFKNSEGDLIIFGEAGGVGYFIQHFRDFEFIENSSYVEHLNSLNTHWLGLEPFENFYEKFGLRMIPQNLLEVFLEIYEQVLGDTN